MILNFPIKPGRAKKVFGFTGSALWLLIIPIKLSRFFNFTIFEALSNNLPSFLGAAGLFLILLSTKGKLSKLTIVQSALIAISVSIIVEAVQLIPRPGILAYVHYTFDYLDILFSITGVVIFYLIFVLLYSKNILKN
jgi:hypothetical protein